MKLGFLGGTGPLGRGLALRFAMAGHECIVGSRTAERGAEAAEGLNQKVDQPLPVRGTENATAAEEADIVFVTVPYEGQEKTVAGLSDRLDGKIVVNTVNALGWDDDGPYPVSVSGGSAAEECQTLLPGSRVVGAFQNISATLLLRPEHSLDADVLVVGDDHDARRTVVDLVADVRGLRGVDAGLLRLARPIEEITAVLIAVNRAYKTHTGLRLSGMDHA